MGGVILNDVDREWEEARLSRRPDDERARELWLQHAVGFLFVRDVRMYARDQLRDDLDPETRKIAEDAIDHALYGVMMLIDGVNGPLRNERHEVDVRAAALLTGPEKGPVIQEIDIRGHGDGFCMGYHGWIKGDFGEAIDGWTYDDSDEPDVDMSFLDEPA